MTALTTDQFARYTSSLSTGKTIAPEGRHRPLLSAAVVSATDLLAAFLAACAVQVPVGATLTPTTWRQPLALFVLLIAYLAGTGRYTARRPALEEMRRLLAAAGVCLLLSLSQTFWRDALSSSLRTTVATILFCILASLGNLLAKSLLGRLKAWQVRVVIVGDGRTADEAESALRSNPSIGYHVVGRIAPGAIDVHAGSTAMHALMAPFAASRLLIAIDDDPALQRRLVDSALCEAIGFSVVPSVAASPSFSSHPTRFFGHDIIMHCADEGIGRRAARLGKTVADRTAAVLLLAIFSPLFLVLFVLSRLDGGPALYSHSRIGIGGRPFHCLKFRTMVVDAECRLAQILAEDPERAAEWRSTRKLKHDPRITPLGHFLRRTSLDELPQLFNILRGEMSLIGPRPISESEIPLYGDEIGRYLGAKPGLTGIWQVSGRSNISYERRVQLDAWYVRNWTLRNDLAILFRTIPAVLRRDGAQ